MGFAVFYLQEKPQGAEPHKEAEWTPKCSMFDSNELSQALKECEKLRTMSDVRHVTMSSELKEMVGKIGVDSIIDGKTPDGQDYDWSKQGRAGRMRKSDLTKTVIKVE